MSKVGRRIVIFCSYLFNVFLLYCLQPLHCCWSSSGGGREQLYPVPEFLSAYEFPELSCCNHKLTWARGEEANCLPGKMAMAGQSTFQCSLSVGWYLNMLFAFMLNRLSEHFHRRGWNRWSVHVDVGPLMEVVIPILVLLFTSGLEWTTDCLTTAPAAEIFIVSDDFFNLSRLSSLAPR